MTFSLQAFNIVVCICKGKKGKNKSEKKHAPRQNCHICFRKYRQNTDDRVKREKSSRHLYFNVVNK